MMTDNGNAPDVSLSEAIPPAGTALGVVAQASSTLQIDAVKGIAATLPPGAFRTDDHRYYFNGRGPLPSVTTILDIMSKPALITWKAKEAARAIAQPLQKGVIDWAQRMTEEDLVKWAVAEADKKRNDSARIGTGVHHLADMVARAEVRSAPGDAETATEAFQVPDEWIPYMEAWKAFLGRYSASSIVSSEHMVWSEWGYAGTYDLIMKIPKLFDQHGNHEVGPDLCTVCRAAGSELWLIDIKTGGGPYPEWALQLAGYRWADAIILENDPKPYPMPQIDRTGVLHLNPNLYPDTGWKLIEYPTRPREFEAFTHALSLYLWREEGLFNKKNLIPIP